MVSISSISMKPKNMGRKGKAIRSFPPPSLKKTRLHLLREETVGQGLKTLALLQLQAARTELQAKNISAEAVHDVRTYIKKVRSIIQLAAPALGRNRRDHLIEILSEVSARLAPIRDADARLQCLDMILGSSEFAFSDNGALRNGIADIAKQQRFNGIRKIPKILELIKKMLKTVPDWPLDQLGEKDLRRRILRIYRRGRTTLDLCMVNYTQEVFHSWRKLVKHLWYSLRISARFWPHEAAFLITELNAISEFVGKERDFSLLVDSLRNGPRTKDSIRLITIIDSHLPTLRAESLALGVRFYEAKPKTFISAMEI